MNLRRRIVMLLPLVLMVPFLTAAHCGGAQGGQAATCPRQKDTTGSVDKSYKTTKECTDDKAALKTSAQNACVANCTAWCATAAGCKPSTCGEVTDNSPGCDDWNCNSDGAVTVSALCRCSCNCQ